jgi:hypothetical protein
VTSLLGDRGRVLLSVPAFRLLWTHHDDLNRHFHRFTRRSLRSTAEDAGLQIEEGRYLFQWLFVAKLAARARERVLGGSPPEEVPHRRLNDALYRACSIERALVGRRMPFGSSLLAVLRKPRRAAS